MNKKVSVIVPVYNSQDSIQRCINSILRQTYNNLEIIIVNDGSTDKTEEICKKITNNDDRVKYYYKNNSGVSETRNFGLEKATGDYIAFVDADDFIEENMYEIMLKEIGNANIIICNCFLVTNNRKIKSNIKMTNSTYGQLNEMIKNVNNQDINRYVNPPWNKLIERKLIIEENIMFNSEISVGEDLLFNLMCMKLSKEIKTIDKELYNYTINNDGLSTKTRNIEDCLKNSINLINELIYILKGNTNIENIIFNEFRNVITRMINQYKKDDIIKFFKSTELKLINNVNYKLLNRKNYLIYKLLQHKKYQLIILFYKIKNR